MLKINADLSLKSHFNLLAIKKEEKKEHNKLLEIFIIRIRTFLLDIFIEILIFNFMNLWLKLDNKLPKIIISVACLKINKNKLSRHEKDLMIKLIADLC